MDLVFKPNHEIKHLDKLALQEICFTNPLLQKISTNCTDNTPCLKLDNEIKEIVERINHNVIKINNSSY